jgi:hypothetical protein
VLLGYGCGGEYNCLRRKVGKPLRRLLRLSPDEGFVYEVEATRGLLEEISDGSSVPFHFLNILNGGPGMSLDMNLSRSTHIY